MTDQVRFASGGFSIFVRGNAAIRLWRVKKGSPLQYPIMEHTAPGTSHTLIQALWPKQGEQQPRKRLKTLISRLRSILNQCNPGLGAASWHPGATSSTGWRAS